MQTAVVTYQEQPTIVNGVSFESGDGLTELLARQRTAFLRDGAPSLAERRANLKKLRAGLLARRADFEAALDTDFGHRSRHETAIMEMLALTWGIDYLHKNLRRFMRRERRHVALPMLLARAHVEYQPLGVIGIMARGTTLPRSR